MAQQAFRFQLLRDKLRKVRRQEGQYLLRSNLCAEDPATLWKYYMLLVEVEEAFKTLKMDLSVRPIYHRKDKKIEAHIFVAFPGIFTSNDLETATESPGAGPDSEIRFGEGGIVFLRRE